jgi:predicted alpha/beta-fold hydrolase
MWAKFFRRVPLPPGRLLRWPTADDDFVEVFRVDAPPEAPRLVVFHGLEGTLRSHYARAILRRAHAAGWGADMLLFRSCGSELNRAPRFYHSGETSDPDFVIRRIVAEFPDAPLLLVGYSLGGNVLLKWLGEQQDRHPSSVRAAVAVSVPFDLAAGSAYVSRGFSHIYELHFLRTLKRKAQAKLARYPELCDPSRLEAARTLMDFDDVVTAPVHGFRDAQDYYRRSSSIGFLSSIRVPTLLLAAYDDPFLPPSVLQQVERQASANTALQAEFVARGGHVGFIGGANPLRPRYYADDRIMAFLASHLRHSPPAADG